MSEKASEIIRTAREKKGWTQTEVAEMLAQRLGQTYSLRQYQRIEDGEFPKYKTEVVSNIENILGIKVYDLIYDIKFPRETGRDDMGPKYREMLWFGKVAPNQENYFPLIPHKARAGYSKNYENADYLQENFEYYPMPPGISPRGAEWRWFEVGGESMLPVLTDGDYLLCSLVPHADWTDIDEFKIHVIVWKNDVSVKRVAVNNKDYILISENEEEEKQKRVPLSDVKEVWKVRRRITAQLPPSKRFKITV
jgi:phage repressor protein C with HTH and peptisase S24 domain